MTDTTQATPATELSDIQRIQTYVDEMPAGPHEVWQQEFATIEEAAAWLADYVQSAILKTPDGLTIWGAQSADENPLQATLGITGNGPKAGMDAVLLAFGREWLSGLLATARAYLALRERAQRVQAARAAITPSGTSNLDPLWEAIAALLPDEEARS